MVHQKTRWKWHECLQARNEIDSECENDDYGENSLNPTSNQGDSKEDILIKQEQLKEEAKAAFVVSAKMARMQVEIERQGLNKQRSSVYDFIGINANVKRPLSTEILEEMNIGQLQVIVNDLYRQIEVNNHELINLLIERDSLSMEQDSILVDIEDLTKRLQERAIDQPKPATDYIYILKHPKRSIFEKFFWK